MFKDLYDYKKNADFVMTRMSALYDDAARGKTGHLLFRVLLPSDTEIYNNIKLNQYDFDQDADLDRYVHDLWFEYAKSFEARKYILDDAMPEITPVLGIGDYSAFVGGDIYFTEDTSWSKPILTHIDDYKKLTPIGTATWYKKFLDICERILIFSKSSGIPFIRGFFSPMDLAGALRGENIYYDFYDSPDALHGLLDYCADATICFAKDIYALAEKYLGQTKYGTWFLKNKINMSEDISCMISADLYREFAAPYTQKVIDYFGFGYMHCHSRALYLVKEICSLRNVVHLWIATDPNQPRPIDHIDELTKDAQGVCLAIDCESFDEIEDNIDRLRKGNYSICLPVSDLDEAQRVVEKFDSHQL